MQARADIDVNYFPGFTRKSLTFSIDDGNLKFDKIFLDNVRPHGILGTFNLCYADRLPPEEMREFYRGYEIANHCKNHPRVFSDGITPRVSDEPFSADGGEDFTAENPIVYKTDIDGLYYYHPYPNVARPGGWYRVATPSFYIECVDSTRAELEAVFGEGSVGGYVWPSARQNNTEVREHLISAGYYGIRRTGDVLDTTGFALPLDRTDWSYNARESNLLSVMEKYEAYPDDGELKFFCFGLHSHDYEYSGKWGELSEFCKRYGDRPEDYYYATNGEIFAYADAVKKIEITESEIKNPTDKTLYVKINGVKSVLAPNSTYII